MKSSPLQRWTRRAPVCLLVSATALAQPREPLAAAPQKIAYVVVMQIGADEETVEDVVEQLVDSTEARVEAAVQHETSRPAKPQCEADPSCVQELGRSLAADRVGFVKVAAIGSTVRVSVDLFDCSSGEARMRAQIEYENSETGDAWRQKLIGLVTDLYPHARTEALVPAAAVATSPPAAVLVDVPAPIRPGPGTHARKLWWSVAIAGVVAIASTALLLHSRGGDSIPTHDLPPP